MKQSAQWLTRRRVRPEPIFAPVGMTSDSTPSNRGFPTEIPAHPRMMRVAASSGASSIRKWLAGRIQPFSFRTSRTLQIGRHPFSGQSWCSFGCPRSTSPRRFRTMRKAETQNPPTGTWLNQARSGFPKRAQRDCSGNMVSPRSILAVDRLLLRIGRLKSQKLWATSMVPVGEASASIYCDFPSLLDVSPVFGETPSGLFFLFRLTRSTAAIATTTITPTTGNTQSGSPRTFEDDDVAWNVNPTGAGVAPVIDRGAELPDCPGAVEVYE